MRKPFKRSGGNDLHYRIECTCPSERWKDSPVAHIMKTEILLSGYADDFFFDEVNKSPRVTKCSCGKEYQYQWFRDGIEINLKEETK